MKVFEEFKAFAMRGNVLDMAVGIIIGAAFGKIISSLVSDVIMPPIGLLTGGVSFSQQSLQLKAASVDAAGKELSAVTLNYGSFIDVVINFLIVAFAIFVVIKAMNAARRKEAPAPLPPPGPTKQELLLTEIRDLLARKA